MRISFADCTLDTEGYELLRQGASVDVEPQVFDLIALLAQNPGRLITKDELQEKIWGGRIVSDSAISARITAARKAVGDNGKDQRIIRTAPRRGIQFVADVATDTPEAPPAAPARLDRPTIRYARTQDGASIAYSVTGSGPPLILIHGWPEFWLTWHKVMARLADAFHLIVPDLRGFGASDKPTFGPLQQLLHILHLIDPEKAISKTIVLELDHCLRLVSSQSVGKPGVGKHGPDQDQISCMIIGKVVSNVSLSMSSFDIDHLNLGMIVPNERLVELGRFVVLLDRKRGADSRAHLFQSRPISL